MSDVDSSAIRMLLMGQVLLGVLAPLGECPVASVWLCRPSGTRTGVTVAEPPRTLTGFLFHETRVRPP
ncbi:hypothetical protein PD653_3122 [Nocardioides sp. PD653]|nr:hypothetical protein PD653B2_1529 [Nocardioides sp. PD653-B2]GAW55697.1 hypothetical protein PD653_3122 [Nocardioides sp. PD653]